MFSIEQTWTVSWPVKHVSRQVMQNEVLYCPAEIAMDVPGRDVRFSDREGLFVQKITTKTLKV